MSKTETGSSFQDLLFSALFGMILTDPYLFIGVETMYINQDSTVDTSQESLPEPQYRRPVYDEPDAYLELSRANVSLGHQNKDDEFVFYDGVSFAADPQMCAEWCGMIQECHSFQFVELLDDEVLDLGMCILKASPKKALESLDESHESEVDSEFDYETLD
jgi:hypothetical protein